MLVGIIGKANVGKSTFFKSATLSEVEIANYPFATIKPNHGVGYVKVPCAETFFKVKCNPRFGYCLNSIRFVPIDLLDVAGLVPGAHEGKGMGNQFLDDLRQADVLIHVVDMAGSTNEKGEPIQPGSYDPANDIRFLEVELDMWYFGLMKKVWEKFARQTNQEQMKTDKAIVKQFSGLGATDPVVKALLKELGMEEKGILKWTEEDVKAFSVALRKKTKPMIIAANKMDIPAGQQNFEHISTAFPHLPMIPCSAESELALKEAAKHGLIDYVPGEKSFKVINDGKLSSQQSTALQFIQEKILNTLPEGSGVQAILNAAVFKVLGYIPIFPGGMNKLQDQEGRTLPDCFLLPKNSTALDFAFKVHTDLGKNFIRAIDVKTRMTVGKEHPLKFGDVIEIIANK